MRYNAVSRAALFYAGFSVFAAILVGKLFIEQILSGEQYRREAERQYAAPSAHLFDRGGIYFTEKDGTTISAATLRSGAAVAINPTALDDPQKAYEKLSEVLAALQPEEFFRKAAKEDDPYELIAGRVSQRDAKEIRTLNIPGVLVVRDRWRFYPAKDAAAHTLGFVGYKGNELGGRYGLERYYNDVLAREDPKLYVNFFAEVFTNISSTLLKASNEREGDLITSIEPTVQAFLEGTLRSIKENWSAKAAGGIIIDPGTGAIYAMAALPAFDPNMFNTEEDIGVFANPLVERVYEMGSIIKPLTMAAGLDAGVVTPGTRYIDRGSVTISGSRIENYDGKGRGEASMQDVLNQSLNTGAVFVMKQLGKERFRDYMLGYGFGEETGIDLPNESAGLVENLKSTRDIEYATASFGQGVAMTPIATARALAVLANGGLLVTPHVASAIDYEKGGTHAMSPLPPERVLSKEASLAITRMLVRVVDDALLGGGVALPRHSIAAKTGTAQIAREEGRGYYPDRYLHSFFGYFPAYDPGFLIFLYAVEPEGVRYASQTLTHPFIDTAKFLLNYYEIPPDR